MKGKEYYDSDHDSPGGTGLKKIQWLRLQLKMCILKSFASLPIVGGRDFTLTMGIEAERRKQSLCPGGIHSLVGVIDN